MTDQKITVLYQLCWKSLGGKAHHTWSRRGNRRWKGSEAGGSLVAHSPAVRANRQDRSDSHSAWNSEHNVYKSPCYVSIKWSSALCSWYRWQQSPYTDRYLHCNRVLTCLCVHICAPWQHMIYSQHLDIDTLKWFKCVLIHSDVGDVATLTLTLYVLRVCTVVVFMWSFNL